jgi:hypothetical protein
MEPFLVFRRLVVSAEDYVRLAAPKAAQSRFMVQPSILWGLLPLALGACWTLPLLLSSAQAKLLVVEDGFFETMGALLFLSTGVLLLATWRNCRRRANATGLLLLALLMIFISGEEISWGQRIFGWQTPGGFENVQDETTIHNHPWFDKSTAGALSMNNLFEYFCIGYGFLLSVVAPYTTWLSSMLRRCGIPIVPLALGAAFPVNYLVTKLYQSMISDEWILRVAELRECAQALVWFAIACVFFRFRRSLL